MTICEQNNFSGEHSVKGREDGRYTVDCDRPLLYHFFQFLNKDILLDIMTVNFATDISMLSDIRRV